jgi:hypothetical protein
MNNEKIEEYLKLNEEKKILEEKIEELKKDIKLDMKCENLNIYSIDTADVFYSEVTRKNLDKNKLTKFIKEEELNECYSESTFDKLEVKRKQE